MGNAEPLIVTGEGTWHGDCFFQTSIQTTNSEEIEAMMAFFGMIMMYLLSLFGMFGSGFSGWNGMMF